MLVRWCSHSTCLIVAVLHHTFHQRGTAGHWTLNTKKTPTKCRQVEVAQRILNSQTSSEVKIGRHNHINSASKPTRLWLHPSLKWVHYWAFSALVYKNDDIRLCSWHVLRHDVLRRTTFSCTQKVSVTFVHVHIIQGDQKSRASNHDHAVISILGVHRRQSFLRECRSWKPLIGCTSIGKYFKNWKRNRIQHAM